MGKVIKVFYKGLEIENRHSIKFGKAIADLGLKKGDEIESFPFNYFDNEGTETKRDVLDYQCKKLIIEKLEYKLIDSWNGLIETIINIFLV